MPRSHSSSRRILIGLLALAALALGARTARAFLPGSGSVGHAPPANPYGPGQHPVPPPPG